MSCRPWHILVNVCVGGQYTLHQQTPTTSRSCFFTDVYLMDLRKCQALEVFKKVHLDEYKVIPVPYKNQCPPAFQYHGVSIKSSVQSQSCQAPSDGLNMLFLFPQTSYQLMFTNIRYINRRSYFEYWDTSLIFYTTDGDQANHTVRFVFPPGWSKGDAITRSVIFNLCSASIPLSVSIR